MPLSSDSSSASSCAVRLDQLGERVDQPGALGRADLAQRAVERSPRGGDGPLDVLGPALGDLGDRLAGRRVEGLEGAAVGGGHPLAADQMAAGPATDEVASGFRQGLGGGRGHRRHPRWS